MLVAAATILAASTAQAQTNNGNYACSSLTGNVFFNPCTGENVLITDGQVCTSVSLKVDASGGFHFTFQFKSDFVGVGLTTGASYVEHNAAGEVENVSGTSLQFNFDFKQNYHVQTSGPANNLTIKELDHITVDANGNITAMQVIEQIDDCK
jgi:hypothetical protein